MYYMGPEKQHHTPSPGCANVRAESDQRKSFPLLRVCRLIYDEAKLFPVKYNSFMFTNNHSLSWFQAKYPLPIQLQTIERIAFATEELGPLVRDPDGKNQDFTQLVPLKSLPNLKGVTVAIHGFAANGSAKALRQFKDGLKNKMTEVKGFFSPVEVTFDWVVGWRSP
jgi:hypothetical protein